MAKRQINEPADDLPIWDLMHKLFADEHGLLTIKNDRGEIVDRMSKNRLRELCADPVYSPAVDAVATTFCHRWRDIIRMVADCSLEMTLARSLSGEDRVTIDPRMVGYLGVVRFLEPEPILAGPDGAYLYAPRFALTENHNVPGFAWSKIAYTYLKDKYLDGILPTGVTQRDVARDALAKAAESDSLLGEFMSHSQEFVVEGVRREISRQFRGRRKRRISVTRAHPPTGGGRLRSAAIDESN